MTTWARGVDFKNSNNTKRIGGIGVYGNDTTAEKLYIGLGAEPWNNIGLQLTNSTINFKGNKIYHAGDKPTLKELGAADINHTHNYLPLTGGSMTGNLILRLGANALSGTGITTGNTQVIGTSAEMLYFGNPKTKIKLESIQNPEIHVNGANYVMYHTGHKPSPSDIGAAKSDHTHNYIPLSGSNQITGPLRSNSEIQTTSQNAFRAVSGNYGFFVRNDGTNTYFMLTNSGDQYGNWNNLRPITINNATGVVTLGNGANGNLTGNASTATKLAASKIIALSGDATGSASFDGSSNATINATVRKTCLVGSDADNTSGWYKVASQTMSGYGDTNITFAVTSTYAYYNSGILQLQIRADNTSISCKRLAWHSRMGLSNSHYIININGMTWTLYAYQPHNRYGRIMFEVISQSSINDKNSGVTLYNTSTKESSNPTATVTSSDGATVGTANSLTNERTFTIGKTGKKFNGTANVSWTTDEIGALDKFNDSTLASSKKIYLGYSGSWLTGDSTYGTVNLEAGGNLTIRGDRDCSSAGEYVSLTAGNNDLKVTSSGSGTEQDKLTFNGNIVYHAGRKPSLNELGAAASNHNHSLVSLSSEAFGMGYDLNTYNSDKMWVGRTADTTLNRPADWLTVLNVGAEHSSNFQLAHSYGNVSHLYVRGRHDTSGAYTPWAKVYTDQNKPSCSDIGAATSNHNHDGSYLKLTGGTMTGNLILRLSGGTLSGAGITTGNTQIIGTAADTIYFGNPKTKITLESISNPFVSINGTTYTMYHTGNKPSYSDIGAAKSDHTHNNYAPTSHNHTSLTGVNSISFAAHETDAVSMGVLVDGTKSYMDFNLADDLDDMWRWRYTLSGSPTFNAMTLQALSGTTSRLTVAGEIAATSFSGAFSGNAKTATSLQTARSIFGQSFNGNADVQGKGTFYGSYASSATTRWQYAGVEIREAGLVSNKQSDIAYAPRMSFHWGNTIASSIAMSSTGEFQFTAQNGTSYSNVRAGTFIGALSGNATTATTLQTARTINGTSFNGAGSITTNIWGSSRTITIGNTGKPVNGSGNVTWTLSEIGASASNHTHSNYLSTSGGTLSGAIKFSTATIGASANSNTLQVTGTNDSGMGGIKLGAGGCRIYGKKDAAILFVEGGIFTNDTLQTSDAVIPGAYKNNNSDATNGWARIVRGCTDNVGSVKVQVGGTNTTASFEVVNPNWSTAWFSCGNTGIRSNSYSNFSDERLKTNIEETKKISNKINQIGVYTYNYLSDFDTEISTYSGEARLCENMPEKRWGVIAQEVEELFPELITESKTLIDGENKVVKSVDVYGLTVLTLEFAKEIYKENQLLKKEIELIKEKLGL